MNLHTRVSNKITCTFIFFGKFSKKFIKYEVVFYVLPKKSYLIPCALIWACTFIRDTRELGVDIKSQISGASIMDDFFESLKHANQE